MKRILFISFLHFAIVMLISSASPRPKEVTIAWTSNTSGKLRDCGCPGDPYGGLSERVSMIKKLRSTEAPFLLVDTGNITSLYGDYKLKQKTIVNMMALMEYQAGMMGRLEMYHGIDNALAIADSADFQIMSASIVRDGTADYAFEPYTILKQGSATVGFTAVTDSSLYIFTGAETDDFDILQPDKALVPVLDTLSRTCDFIVVMSHMEQSKSLQLLSDYPTIDLVLQAFGNRRLEHPEVTPDGILAASGSRGQFIGMITLVKKGDNRVDLKQDKLIPVLDMPADERAAKMVTAYYKGMK